MKVLWLCNIMLPIIAKDLGLPYSNREGWLSGLYEQFSNEEDKKIELAVCFPHNNKESSQAMKARDKEEIKHILKFKIGSMTYYSFRENLTEPEKYVDSMEEQMQGVLRDFSPDLIHIFGSEFPHSLAMASVCKDKSRILLSIQGICGKIAQNYTQGIPKDIVETFRDIVKQDSIEQQQQKFFKRAKHEQLLFALIKHVSGRTKFDNEAALELNPNITYHHLNESMRESFYQGRWNSSDCEPYSIFLSQGDYPIKGFHYMLEAMPRILYKYPDAQLYVAGNNIIGETGYDMMDKLKNKVKISSYGKYLRSLIINNQLEGKVIMLGSLDEKAMKERFLKSSVFVCPSIIENSPNSLCEAMLLGMPVVAAAVGGIPSLVSDQKNGLLYEPGNISDLAAAIQIAWDLETGEVIADAAAKRAKIIHNQLMNYMKLKEIYKEIAGREQ